MYYHSGLTKIATCLFQWDNDANILVYMYVSGDQRGSPEIKSKFMMHKFLAHELFKVEYKDRTIVLKD